MAHYEEYFIRQAQTGQGMAYYAGSHGQRGHGLGSVLGGLFRSVFPFFGSNIVKTLGREAFRAGSGILTDIASGNMDPMESMKRRGVETGHRLLDHLSGKMEGNGIKRVARRSGPHSGRVVRRAHNSSGAKNRAIARRYVNDIFG